MVCYILCIFKRVLGLTVGCPELVQMILRFLYICMLIVKRALHCIFWQLLELTQE